MTLPAAGIRGRGRGRARGRGRGRGRSRGRSSKRPPPASPPSPEAAPEESPDAAAGHSTGLAAHDVPETAAPDANEPAEGSTVSTAVSQRAGERPGHPIER